MGNSGGPGSRVCIDCARPIPSAARKCGNDGCGAYQDWRRFFGGQVNVTSLLTLLGVAAAIGLNILQANDLANKATREDIQVAKDAIGNEVRRAAEGLDSKLARVKATISDIEKELLSIPEEYQKKHEEFLKLSGTGLAKLLPAGLYSRSILIFGGGAYYSFTHRSNDAAYGAHVILHYGKLDTGFAGVDYGFFMQLGDIPINILANETSNIPDWLPSGSHDAWAHMFTYAPPIKLADARLEQRKYSREGVRLDSTTLSGSLAGTEGISFLLRSMSFGDSDVLVAARIEKRLDDGSLILVWRLLKAFPTPNVSGPDLPQ